MGVLVFPGSRESTGVRKKRSGMMVKGVFVFLLLMVIFICPARGEENEACLGFKLRRIQMAGADQPQFLFARDDNFQSRMARRGPYGLI